MRDGVITYLCQTNPDGSLNTAQCPGGTVLGKNGPHTIQPGYYGLTPQQITNMDPLFTNPPAGFTGSVGPSPIMLQYLNTFPHSNDNSVGDGVNFQGYPFKGPVSINNNWYIARVDYKITSNGNQELFWRGGPRNDTNAGVPYLPGQASETTTVNYSKGFTVGYTAVLKPTLVNNFRYGYTRESFGQIGNQNTEIIFFRGLNDNSTPNNSSLAVTNSLNYQVPVNNFVDDISWVRGKHTLQFGANLSFLRNPQSTNANSFSSATTNASWFDTAALANTGAPGHFDPGFEGYPAVDSSFGNNYDYPMIALVAELPLGKGRWIAGDAHGIVEALIGGWQLSGLARLTSGFPIGVGNGAQWPTNWQLSGYATQIGPVKTIGASKNPGGTVNIFGNTAAAATALAAYAPDLPGFVGARNTLRGDGFAGLDLGLDKRWQKPWKESHTLQFRWEVFNALNLTRFDVQA